MGCSTDSKHPLKEGGIFMAKATSALPASTGLLPTQQQRYHYDIYAVLEGTQELYFGEDVAVNVNLVEKVKVACPIPAGDGQPTRGFEILEKCYLSPTKRRGVERRTLIWAPTAQGVLLGDLHACGIPGTCAKQDCPICSAFGALQPKQDISFVGRLTHSGGVAIQPILPEVKQRAMHPSTMTRQEGVTPMPYRREYNEPALLYPVYNHCLSLTDQEFASVAYAFLNALSRLGASNPKGVRLAEGRFLASSDEPLLVLDRYLAPLGKRPIISPQQTNPQTALEQFREAALFVYGEHEATQTIIHRASEQGQHELFQRWIGDMALQELQRYSIDFVQRVLLRLPSDNGGKKEA
jgi:hypothetical protein